MSSKAAAADGLADIVENAERIESYLAGLGRAQFEADTRTRDAVERCLERVREAAHRLGAEATALTPNQPWADIRGMGNRLRHAYDPINVEILWNTVSLRMPDLAADARAALRRVEG